ncbi:MAG: UbiD family decarboxylase [Pseudomonadota bacterium]
MPFKDLREFLDFLEKQGELKTCNREVDSKIEIAKITDKSSKTGGPAILFNRVKGFENRVVTGLFGNLDRAFLMIESDKYNGFKKLAGGLSHPVPTRTVKQGLCQEVVRTGNEVDLHAIPVLWHHAKDTYRFFTGGCCRVRDPDTGIYNSSINRVAVQGKNTLSIQSSPPHQLGLIARKLLGRGQSCPMAMAIGTDPAVLVASVSGIPPSTDEFALAGGLRGEPVDVVKCVTVDVEVPATAELVIEGEIVPGDEDGILGKTEYADEGVFGEVHGYFGKPSRSPVIHVTAITHRKDYIYHALGTSEHTSEHQLCDAIGMHGDVYSLLKDIIPPEDINAINAGSFAAIVSIKKTRPGQGRQLIQMLLAKPGIKRAIIVDEDIDVFNLVEVEWAVQFRSTGDDYIITSELPMINLDPAITREPNLLKKVGIDATIPLLGDKGGRSEVLRDLGPARYPDLDEVDLDYYLGN